MWKVADKMLKVVDKRSKVVDKKSVVIDKIPKVVDKPHQQGLHYPKLGREQSPFLRGHLVLKLARLWVRGR